MIGDAVDGDCLVSWNGGGVYVDKNSDEQLLLNGELEEAEVKVERRRNEKWRERPAKKCSNSEKEKVLTRKQKEAAKRKKTAKKKCGEELNVDVVQAELEDEAEKEKEEEIKTEEEEG